MPGSMQYVPYSEIGTIRTPGRDPTDIVGSWDLDKSLRKNGIRSQAYRFSLVCASILRSKE